MPDQNQQGQGIRSSVPQGVRSSPVRIPVQVAGQQYPQARPKVQQRVQPQISSGARPLDPFADTARSSQPSAQTPKSIFDKKMILITVGILVVMIAAIALAMNFMTGGTTELPPQSLVVTSQPEPSQNIPESVPEQVIDRSGMEYLIPWQADLSTDDTLWIADQDSALTLDNMPGAISDKAFSRGFVEGYRRVFHISDVSQDDFAEVSMTIHKYALQSGAEQRFEESMSLYDFLKNSMSSEDISGPDIGEKSLKYVLRDISYEGVPEGKELSAYVVEFARDGFWVSISFKAYDDYSAAVLKHAKDIEDNILSGTTYAGFV